MIFRKIGLRCYVLLLLYAKPVVTDESKKTSLKNDEVKQTFARLLNTIVKVNEERVVTVKKMAELQDYMLTKNKLKTDYDSYDSLENEDSRILMAYAEAATANEEKIREIFKSNMTRGDFSNLLKSLIRLNEQRVNVLQKLYRLDDYSVLSEVLRSGDKKKGRSGNLSNLFLVVLSKAATANEEKIREIFKSNMTRGDFSNLLKSLIRLNEQRVNVLQKLYRLDDYSVLSEVLRSGDKKKGRSGNLSNLFLVVLSKPSGDPQSRYGQR
uniref:Annexin n=1 Tax=Heliothis virescens TaxID=7102 RepID=A0A2A4JG28_HELVI